MKNINKPQKLKNTKSHEKQRENWKKNISSNPELLSEDLMKELDFRYNYALQLPDVWLSWKEVKSRLLSK